MKQKEELAEHQETKEEEVPAVQNGHLDIKA